jgi:hypothetical protein
LVIISFDLAGLFKRLPSRETRLHLKSRGFVTFDAIRISTYTKLCPRSLFCAMTDPKSDSAEWNTHCENADMIKKLNLKIFTYTGFTVDALSPVAVWAQPENMMMPPPPLRGGDTNRPRLLQVNMDSSYTASGKAKFLGTKSGDSGAASMSAAVFAPLPLNEKWIIPLGLMSQNIWLDSVPGAPVPDQIHTLGFNTGLGYRLNDDWMIMGMFNPTLYKFSDVGGNDIGLSGGINAMWRYSPSLTLMFGLMVSPDSDLKVLPMIGADWRINEEWDLRLMFPQPRLIYQPDEHWSFHFGANMVGTTFRSSDTLGNSISLPQYNDALATYRDIRVGGGVGYQFSKTFRLEVEAGYSVSRQIDYTRIDETVNFDPAPCVRLGLNIGF